MQLQHVPFNEKEMRIDYDGRTDGQPVFQAFAPGETPITTKLWIIFKFTYVSNQVTRRQVVFKKAWSDRSSLF